MCVCDHRSKEWREERVGEARVQLRLQRVRDGPMPQGAPPDRDDPLAELLLGRVPLRRRLALLHLLQRVRQGLESNAGPASCTTKMMLEGLKTSMRQAARDQRAEV